MFLLRRRITWLSATRTTGEEVRSANWSSGCYRGYRAACWKTTQLIAESYTRNRVSEAILSGQPRKLWSVVNKLLHHGSNIGDLCNNDSKRLANNFSRFFNDKLTNLLFKISSALPQSCASINFPSHPMGSVPSTTRSVFTPTTPEEVYKILQHLRRCIKSFVPWQIKHHLLISFQLQSLSLVFMNFHIYFHLLLTHLFLLANFHLSWKLHRSHHSLKNRVLMCLILITFIPHQTCLPHLRLLRNLFLLDSSYSLVTHLTIVPFSLPIARTTPLKQPW